MFPMDIGAIVCVFVEIMVGCCGAARTLLLAWWAQRRQPGCPAAAAAAGTVPPRRGNRALGASRGSGGSGRRVPALPAVILRPHVSDAGEAGWAAGTGARGAGQGWQLHRCAALPCAAVGADAGAGPLPSLGVLCHCALRTKDGARSVSDAALELVLCQPGQAGGQGLHPRNGGCMEAEPHPACAPCSPACCLQAQGAGRVPCAAALRLHWLVGAGQKLMTAQTMWLLRCSSKGQAGTAQQAELRAAQGFPAPKLIGAARAWLHTSVTGMTSER